MTESGKLKSNNNNKQKKDMVSTKEYIQGMIHECLMRLKEAYESKSTQWSFSIGDNAYRHLDRNKRSGQGGLISEIEKFNLGDLIYINEDSNSLFLAKYVSPNKERVHVGVTVSCISDLDKVSTKNLFFGMLDAKGREVSYNSNTHEFVYGATYYAKTEQYHDVFDLASSCSSDYELWNKIRGRSLKVVDIIKYEVSRPPFIDDNLTVYEIKRPVFTLCRENADDIITKQIEFINKKERWGRECKDFRTICNEQNKWGIEDKYTEELIIDYVFDNIEWIEGIDCVKFTLEGKEALWHISKLRDLS